MAFSFGGSSSTGAKPASGFAFGSTTATTQASTGFSFGGATQAAPTPAAASFSFGTPSTSTTAAAGFSFGNTPAATTTAGFPFGTTGSSQPAPAAASSITGFSFAQKQTTPVQGSTTTATATTAAAAGFPLGGTAPATGKPNLGGAPTQSTGGFTLGGSTTAAANASAAAAAGLSLGSAATTAPPPGGGLAGLLGSTVAPQPTAVGGFQMGASAATTTAPTLTLGATTAQSTRPSLLGQVSASSTPAPPAGFKLGGTTTTTTTSATTSLGGFGFGAKPAISITGSTGLTTTPSTTATLSTTTTTTSSAPAAAAVVTSMNYRTLEENINKWTLELEEQEKTFLQQATHVNAWDRMLIENGEKITDLNTNVERVKIDQQRLDQELDFILAQQKELEEMLVPLETAVDQLPPITYQQHADLEREHTYKLSENIDAQLKRMVQDLKEVIEHLNTSNITADTNDPIIQIGKILNAHMDSLQWVDQNTNILQRRVDEVSKLAEHRRKEQEKNFRLAYD